MALLGPLLTVLVCGYALWRGGAPERAAAGLVALVMSGSTAAQAVVGHATVWPVILADVLISAGLLALAIRYERPWMLIAIALAAGLLLVHSLLLEDGAAITPLYRALVNGFNVALLATLAAGTTLAARARRRMLPASA